MSDTVAELKRLHDKRQKAGTYHDDHPESYGAMCDAELADDTFWQAVASLVERVQRAEKALELVNARGTTIQPSYLNRGRVVVVDGDTGLDACEKTALEGIHAILDEKAGGESPMRMYITVTTTKDGE